MGFFDIFRRRERSLEDALGKPIAVKVHGVKFLLRKLEPIHYATGANALHTHFQTYKTADDDKRLEMLAQNGDLIKKHYADVFLSAVVEPALTGNVKKKPGIPVENLFTDWDLANELYAKIIEVSYGKKN